MRQPAILVVDDDESIGDMLQMMLEHKGFTVVVSTQATGLADLILSNHIQLIILDMLIGHLKGTDICVELKQDAATASIPVLMMTALPGIEKACLEAGANDFIAKPFEMDEFIAKVQALIS